MEGEKFQSPRPPLLRPAFQRGAGLSSPSSVPLLPAQMCVLGLPRGLVPAGRAPRGPSSDPGPAEAPRGAQLSQKLRMRRNLVVLPSEPSEPSDVHSDLCSDDEQVWSFLWDS